MNRVEADGKKIEDIMQAYSGADGAHIGLIVSANGGQQMMFGGRSDLIGIGIARLIAKVCEITPGIDADMFIHATMQTALAILHGEVDSADAFDGGLVQ